MTTRANLFGMLSEMILLLLGVLLVLIAVTRGVMLPGRPAALAILGSFFMFWGVRAWAQPGRGQLSGNVRVLRVTRGASLLLVGAAVIAIPFLPLRDSSFALGAAGTVLVIRGILGAIANVRLPSDERP